MTVVEREIKLAAPPANALPPLSDPLAGVVAEPAGTLHLLAIYYDTDDLRLTRAGASLRHRNDEGWAVKLPRGTAADGRLDRSTYAFAGDAASPPSEALELIRALARSASVRPVARLRTTRRAVRLRTTDGTPIGEVVDDDVTVLGPDGTMPGFRELEFELADHAPEAQAASIVARLRASGAGPPDPTPKIVRALGPRAADPPDVRVPAGDAHTVGDVIRAALAGPVAGVVAHDPGVRRGDDPEDVHQARVATRRLRSHLRTFVPLVDSVWAEALREELGWLGAAFGGVRDADVLLERLEAHVEHLPGADHAAADQLLDRLRAQRDQARTELLDVLRSHRYAVLLDRLVDAARQPRLTPRTGDEPDAEILRGLVRRAWERLRERGGRPARPAGRRGPAHDPQARQTGPLRGRGGRAGVREAGPDLRPRARPTSKTCSASTRTGCWPPSGCATPRPPSGTRVPRSRPVSSSPRNEPPRTWAGRRGSPRGRTSAARSTATGYEPQAQAGEDRGPGARGWWRGPTPGGGRRPPAGRARGRAPAPLRRLELPEGQARRR